MVHIDPLCSLFVYSSELPESASEQEKIIYNLCLVQLCPSHGKVSVRQQDAPRGGTPQGSVAFGCVTVLLAALCREVQVPSKREDALKTPFRS